MAMSTARKFVLYLPCERLYDIHRAALRQAVRLSFASAPSDHLTDSGDRAAAVGNAPVADS